MVPFRPTTNTSLPNLLADQPLVDELLQQDCEPERLADAVGRLLESDNAPLLARFDELHRQIRCNADRQAADAVLELIGK